jgi:subtilisin family serine protease
MKLLSSSSAIEIAERMPARWAAARSPRSAADPLLNRQWGLRAIGWFQVKHPSPAAISKIPVAVLDSGVDAKHPDLESRIASYQHRSKRAEDILGHGTHVAGIIAAIANNAIGVTGVASSPLHVWKIFDDEPWEDGDYYVDGEAYLRGLGELETRGCRVVNLSLGGTEQSRTEALLFQRLQERGIVAIAAMGNEYEEGNPIEFPAAYNGVIAVGSVGITLRRSSFSNTGAHIQVMAPGEGILSTLPLRKSAERDEIEYAAWDGTSMATPHVAGAVALLLAKQPHLSASDVRRRLATRSLRLPRMKSQSFSRRYGHGLLYLPKLL